LGAVTERVRSERLIGIEKLRVYPCSLALDFPALCAARGQDPSYVRDTMLVDQRSVNPPYEDPVTMAVNAARPMLTDEDRRSIELLLVGTESGVDLEKPISSWVHRYLELSPSCRSLEVKHACYSGTGGLQLAAAWLASGVSEAAKALVITTDESRMHLGQPHEYVLGAGAAAVLLSARPDLLELELGKSGYYSAEVSDLIRPTPVLEIGNTELSLLAYLEALDGAYSHYLERVGEAVDLDAFFAANVYHVPFGGMTFLAHKELLGRDRDLPKQEARAHFERRCLPSLRYTRRMGGTYSSSTFVALLGLIDASDDLTAGERIGIFSFGSGSCAEFYSGLVGQHARQVARTADLARLLDERYALTVEEYEAVERERTTQVGNPDFTTSLDGLDDWYKRSSRHAAARA
jgi:3-hydroxy-3-methylglutaryl CoA synthase